MGARDIANEPHYVYRYYSADGRCLYIGCTVNIAAREAGHSRSVWFGQAARREFVLYRNRQVALAVESVAIIVRHPAFNCSGRTHRLRHPVLQSALTDVREGRHDAKLLDRIEENAIRSELSHLGIPNELTKPIRRDAQSVA